MIVLNGEEVAVLVAFMESFDLVDNGTWPGVESVMKGDFGVEDPAEELEKVAKRLRDHA